MLIGIVQDDIVATICASVHSRIISIKTHMSFTKYKAYKLNYPEGLGDSYVFCGKLSSLCGRVIDCCYILGNQQSQLCHCGNPLLPCVIKYTKYKFKLTFMYLYI